MVGFFGSVFLLVRFLEHDHNKILDKIINQKVFMLSVLEFKFNVSSNISYGRISASLVTL